MFLSEINWSLECSVPLCFGLRLIYGDTLLVLNDEFVS